MSPKMKVHFLLAIFGILVAGLVQPVSAQKLLAIYVLDFDTNIKGEHRTLAVDLATSIETAFSQRPVFKIVDRRRVNDIIHQYRMERDLRAFARGEPSSPQFIKQMISQADAMLRGELNNDGLGSVILTVSLTKFDSEKPWQSKKVHKLLEWLDPEQQAKDAADLAADAAAKINASGGNVPPTSGDDAVRGIELAKQGHCPEAGPYLTNAAAVDSKNTEVFYQLGRCQNQAGDRESAVHSLAYAIETNPRRSDLFVERAMSYSLLKDFPAAQRDVDQALNIDPGNLAAIELRGDISMQRGRYAEAVEAYYGVYEQQPTRARCQKLADAYTKNGARDASVTLERACISLP